MTEFSTSNLGFLDIMLNLQPKKTSSSNRYRKNCSQRPALPGLGIPYHSYISFLTKQLLKKEKKEHIQNTKKDS